LLSRKATSTIAQHESIRSPSRPAPRAGGRVVGERLDRAIGRDGVTSDHWRVLRRLADGEGHTMGELAEQLQMNPPTLTKLIDRMVGKSLVQRAADPEDSRRVLVYATDAGLGLLTSCKARSTSTMPRCRPCSGRATRASSSAC
jgi:DNA-binding MarR family transcriptional regulator